MNWVKVFAVEKGLAIIFGILAIIILGYMAIDDLIIRTLFYIFAEFSFCVISVTALVNPDIEILKLNYEYLEQMEKLDKEYLEQLYHLKD